MFCKTSIFFFKNHFFLFCWTRPVAPPLSALTERFFVFFISVFYVLLNYEEKNELIIFWGNGITKINFVNKMIYFSIFYFLIQIFFSTMLIPYSQNKARSFRKRFNFGILGIDEGSFSCNKLNAQLVQSIKIQMCNRHSNKDSPSARTFHADCEFT